MVILGSLEYATKFEEFNEMYGVNGKALLEKLTKLTEFQAFMVIRMEYEYLY